MVVAHEGTSTAEHSQSTSGPAKPIPQGIPLAAVLVATAAGLCLLSAAVAGFYHFKGSMHLQGSSRGVDFRSVGQSDEDESSNVDRQRREYLPCWWGDNDSDEEESE